MALRINELFNGPVGVALDTTNTSATSFRAAGGTSVFDTTIVADGTTSAQVTSTTTSSRSAEWQTATASAGYFSFYFSPQQLQSSVVNILVVGTFTTGFTPTCSVFYDAAGKIGVSNQSGAVMGSVTTDSAVLNELNRIDVSFNAGAVHMELYPGNAQASNAVGTATAGNSKTGTTTQTSYNYRALGHYSTATLVSNFDAFREDDTALPPPIPPPPGIPFDVVANQTSNATTGTATAGTLTRAVTAGTPIAVAYVHSPGTVADTISVALTRGGGALGGTWTVLADAFNPSPGNQTFMAVVAAPVDLAVGDVLTVTSSVSRAQRELHARAFPDTTLTGMVTG